MIFLAEIPTLTSFVFLRRTWFATCTETCTVTENTHLHTLTHPPTHPPIVKWRGERERERVCMCEHVHLSLPHFFFFFIFVLLFSIFLSTIIDIGLFFSYCCLLVTCGHVFCLSFCSHPLYLCQKDIAHCLSEFLPLCLKSRPSVWAPFRCVWVCTWTCLDFLRLTICSNPDCSLG